MKDTILCGCGKDKAAILSMTDCRPGEECGTCPGREIYSETVYDKGANALKKAEESVVD